MAVWYVCFNEDEFLISLPVGPIFMPFSVIFNIVVVLFLHDLEFQLKLTFNHSLLFHRSVLIPLHWK